MKDIIMVEKDRVVNITQLHQYDSYMNVVFGYANARTNSYLLDSAIEKAKTLCEIDKIYVIHPGLDKVNPEITSKHPPFIELPKLTCIAELRTDMTKGGQMATYRLGVCWFQDEYAFPIDESILEEFKAIPFSRLCIEYEF